MSDLELVKRNLLTHIYTRRGERLMMANFGTNIPDLIFEPLNEEAVQMVEDELREVFEYDPRVELLQLSVRPIWEESIIFASVKLRYIELQVVDVLELKLQFED